MVWSATSHLSESASSDECKLPLVAKPLRKIPLNTLQVDVRLGLYGIFRRQSEMGTVFVLPIWSKCLRIDFGGT